MVSKANSSQIIVALDFDNEKQARLLTDRLDPSRCRVKVGKELLVRVGPKFVTRLVDDDFDVFLDLKFHDIPNTVAGACAAAADLGCWMANVHAAGGPRMLEAAVAELGKRSCRPILIAVTVLTSLDEAQLSEIGLSGRIDTNVTRLAHLAQRSGLDGVVCSPQEISVLREDLSSDFCLVTPGIRPPGAANDDQHRIATPVTAIQAGANYLVIGRPITRADDPLRALLEIEQSLAGLV